LIDGQRTLAELRRQILRPSTLNLVAGYSVLYSTLALLALPGGEIGASIEFGYYLIPLLMCPIAAHRVLRDDSEGMTNVQAVSPLQRAELETARVAAALAIPPLAIVGTLPALYGVSAAAPTGAFAALLVHVAWALVLSTAAASAGLLVGRLTSNHPRLGVGIAFGLVSAWFLLGISTDPQTAGVVSSAIAKLSPFTYAEQASPLVPLPSGSPNLLAGPAMLAGLGLLAVVAIGPTTARTRRGGAHPLSTVFVALVVLGGVGLLAFGDPGLDHGDPQTQGFPVEEERDGRHWMITLTPGEQTETLWTGAWGEDTPLRLELKVYGAPNETLEIDRVQLASPHIQVEPVNGSSEVLVLDNVVDAPDEAPPRAGEKMGIGTQRTVWTATPTELFQRAPVTLTLSVNEETERFDFAITALNWRTEPAPVAAGAFASGLSTIALARWGSRRWNRW
jgi:hypothetical protein